MGRYIAEIMYIFPLQSQAHICDFGHLTLSPCLAGLESSFPAHE